VVIRRLRPDEAALFKDLRLRALEDSPTSFAETFTEVAAQSPEYWDKLTASVTKPDGQVMFVAEEDGRAVGLVFGLFDRDDRTLGHLGGMWVEPAWRGRGIGRALVGAVIGWARERKLRALALWVTEGNRGAIDLYAAHGFAATGEEDVLSSDPSFRVSRMMLVLV
jgi:GNAT superfamily N-acetyltransferase